MSYRPYCLWDVVITHLHWVIQSFNKPSEHPAQATRTAKLSGIRISILAPKPVSSPYTHPELGADTPPPDPGQRVGFIGSPLRDLSHLHTPGPVLCSPLTLFTKDSGSSYSVPGAMLGDEMNRSPQTGGRWTDRCLGKACGTRSSDTCSRPVPIRSVIHSMCTYGTLTVYQPLKETDTDSSSSSLWGP